MGDGTQIDMTATDVLNALSRSYRPPEWAFFEELRTGTGYNYGQRIRYGGGKDVERRLDAWAFHLWPMGGYCPTGFEVKVSRSDFLREMGKQDKTTRYMELCQFFYYVTPKALVQPDEVPESAGLIWVNGRGCRIKKRAPHRDIPQPEWAFFAAVCRRVNELELIKDREEAKP